MRGLLFCNHEPTRAVIEEACRDCDIHLTVYENAAECTEAVRAWRFEAVIVDCDDTHGGPRMLRVSRQAFANRRSGILGILNGGTTKADALDSGADLTIDKPLNRQLLRERLIAIKHISSPERRRHARTAVDMPVYVSCGDVVGRLATASDISAGGIRLQLSQALDDEMVAIRFQLPETSKPLQLRGEIVWADADGRVGVRFLSISHEAQAEIRDWQKRAVAAPAGYAYAV